MGDRAVDDVRLAYARRERRHAGIDLGDHATRHRALIGELDGLGKRHAEDERRLVIEVRVDAVDIGDEDDLLRTDRRRASRPQRYPR